ncbi:chemotaxis-specific protein-glutamate methyltransferase CheB [Erythrobacter sp. THAF29]|uniref:chemotaxis-specific protein-glutamate methyltransferase CheB n=1 Tax=Erythrobacter sp. THAF29 TaxID=2587851 RepID=UPI0012A8155D|nr:chemotaxis-specific protein-glutamate methyltransferase CheB [Erythrobacter sp. THAF29]QFT76869.1 Chemotaxis response regulator protein-glutamate methylesterase [Erythrobacter sp. THAF29]
MNAPGNPKGRSLKPTESATRANAVRVMIVDDSLTVRTIFKRMVESDQALAVSDTASSAERAIAQLRNTPADVILLDLEMPGMGGLEALPEILETAAGAQVLVVSSLTDDGAEATMAALSMGAADTMLKPRPGGFNEDYRAQLLGKIKALGGATSDSRGAGGPDPAPKPALHTIRPEVLAIGASTGGIHALNLMLRRITPEFDAPILVTQHLPSSFVPVFARQLEVASARRTVIAEDGTEIRRGEIAVATGHGHMTVRRIADRLIAKVSSEPARSGCLPSVDPMLASLATTFESRVLAVILSGMGRDGLEGARAVCEAGGTIYAQDAETSAVWGMPGAVAKAGLANLVAAPEELADAIMSHAAATVQR